MAHDYGLTGSDVIRFVVVDDHEFTRLGVKAFLQRHRGWQVVGESSAHDAIETCQDLDPDFIVCDVRPSGGELVQRLHATCPRAMLLVLSTFNDEHNVHSALAAGARGYLLKTGNSRELSAAVGAVKGGAFYFSPSISDLIVRNYVFKSALPEDSRPDALSSREREVLQWLSQGKSTKEIAASLGISARTVEGHRSRLMKKVGAHTSSELIRYAIRSGIAE